MSFNRNKKECCIISIKMDIIFQPIKYDNTTIIPSAKHVALEMDISEDLIWLSMLTSLQEGDMPPGISSKIKKLIYH